MEKCSERALKRDGHKTLVIDDKRANRVIGRKLTQKWALSQSRRFKADFVILGKCHGLDIDTVRTIIEGKPNCMWYHYPQCYKSTTRPVISHIFDFEKRTNTCIESCLGTEG